MASGGGILLVRPLLKPRRETMSTAIQATEKPGLAKGGGVNLTPPEIVRVNLDGVRFRTGTAKLMLGAPAPADPAPADPDPPVRQLIRSPSGRRADDLVLRPLRFEVEDVVDRGDKIDIVTWVLDRRDGERLRLTFALPINPQLEGRRRARRIRSLILKALVHELDECLDYSDGTPVVDPHPERRTGDYAPPFVDRAQREAAKGR